MPKYGISIDDTADKIVKRGLGPDNLNRSERIQRLIILGGSVEGALDAARVPQGRREPLDVELFVKRGVEEMREQGTLRD